MRRLLLLAAVACAPPAATSLTVGVLGAQGDLGREVVAQCLARGWDVNAYVRRPTDPVLYPVRRGWLSPDADARRSARPQTSPRLRVLDSARVEGGEDALVSVMSGRPFSDETRTVGTFRDACARLSSGGDAARVCLVSAHGVGDSIEGADAGIQLMRAWYLRGTYAAKEAQEDHLRTTRRNGTYTILRPRVLSYAPIPLNPVARTRLSVAREICDWIASR